MLERIQSPLPDTQGQANPTPRRMTPCPSGTVNALLDIHIKKFLLNNYLNLEFPSILNEAKSVLTWLTFCGVSLESSYSVNRGKGCSVLPRIPSRFVSHLGKPRYWPLSCSSTVGRCNHTPVRADICSSSHSGWCHPRT